MFRTRGEIYWTVLLSVAGILLLGSTVGLLIGSLDEGTLTTRKEGWDGLSRVYDALKDGGYEVDPLITSSTVLFHERDPKSTLYLSVGPEREYSLSETQAIRKFHSRGGRLFIADDSEDINGLMNQFDVTVLGGQLYDENFYRNPDFIRVDADLVDVFSGVLLLNRPSSLLYSSGRTVAMSSPSSWVDINGNGERDMENTTQGETLGPKAVCMIADPEFRELDTGCAVFMSDPSFLLNEMIGEEDNLEFFLSLVSYLLPEGGRIIIDEGMHQLGGLSSSFQRASMMIVLLTSDVNLKIITASMVLIIVSAFVYLFETPEKLRHMCLLDRTGLAELVEPNVSRKDVPEIKKVFLDKVRIANSMTVEDFARLEWDELEKLIHNRELFQFVQGYGSYRREEIERILVEVSRWQG